MRFKIDENLPIEAAVALRECKFHAETIWDEHLSGADDNVILSRARDEVRILITLDLDFANIKAYPPGEYAGIIVLKLRKQDKAAVIACILRLVVAIGERAPKSELWIVEPDRIRFRSQH